MKAAFLTELLSVRSLVLQSLALFLVVGVFVLIGMQSAIGMVAGVSAMAPLLMVFSLFAYDDLNGWERYRAAMPLSRSAIVASRYAVVLAVAAASSLVAIALSFAAAAILSVVLPDAEMTAHLLEETARPAMLLEVGAIGGGFMLVVSAFLLPAILRFGMNKAMRYVPTAIFVVVMALVLVLPNVIEMPQLLTDLGTWLENPANAPAAIAAIAAVTLAVYAASCGVARALYRSKDL